MLQFHSLTPTPLKVSIYPFADLNQTVAGHESKKHLSLSISRPNRGACHEYIFHGPSTRKLYGSFGNSNHVASNKCAWTKSNRPAPEYNRWESGRDNDSEVGKWNGNKDVFVARTFHFINHCFIIPYFLLLENPSSFRQNCLKLLWIKNRRANMIDLCWFLDTFFV